MQKPDMDELANLLKEENEHNGGTLPELYRIAWHAYLMTDVIDHVDYDKVREYFPSLEDDPDKNDPVNAMGIGKHYKDNYYGVPEGEFVDESDFQALYREIMQETKHFGGQLSPPYTVALAGQLLGLHHCSVITDSEYEQLLSMLPTLEDNPVDKINVWIQDHMIKTDEPRSEDKSRQTNALEWELIPLGDVKIQNIFEVVLTLAEEGSSKYTRDEKFGRVLFDARDQPDMTETLAIEIMEKALSDIPELNVIRIIGEDPGSGEIFDITKQRPLDANLSGL